MKPVEVFEHPLQGLSLIEASAGTGKTTTLVELYLRALLFEPYAVENILAVTFTRAATGELSVRIREALAEVRARLDQSGTTNGEVQGKLPQRFRTELLARAANDSDELAKRVNAALAAFDEKAVFTIHGFCQRALADNAFEAGAAFVTTQTEDEEALLAQAAADFWRRRTDENAPEIYVRWLLATLTSPEELRRQLRDALTVGAELRVEPLLTAADVEKAATAFRQAAEGARETWKGSSKKLMRLLNERTGLNRNTYNDVALATLLEQWEQWLNAPASPSLPDKFELLTLSKLREKTNKGHSSPDHDFFVAAEVLMERAEQLEKAWWQETFASALTYIREQTRNDKREAREIGFDDMLRNLRDALDVRGGEQLARRLAGHYPLILVDEFQDTDPLQLEIFLRIHESAEKHGLILIGDPKQAIYRFRGADVFTYMWARRQCEQSDRLYGLTENYRSTGALLDAFNALFEGRAIPFEYEQIPYSHVTPGREIAALNAEGDAACTVLWHAGADAKILKDEAARIAADVCASEIARMLELGASGKAHYPKDGITRRVEAKDIAVLVDKNRQGLAVQRALRRFGIAAAMVATASVFASEEAGELQIVLAAVAEPANGALLRRALATRLLGATASDLEAWANDESRWGAIVSNFRDYHALWQSRGFAAMFARLIAEEGVIERTLARDDGERAMTNLRQLAELAGEQAAHRPGTAPLLVWFARERANAVKSEDRQLRLESDENLVRIATVHKAKGLEYPIVFLPLLWDAKKSDKKTANPAVLAHDEDYRSVLDLGSEEFAQRQKDSVKEARSEEARKLYVALTRAQHACYLIAMPANQLELAALARMLNVDEPEELQSKLRDWEKAAGGSVKIRAPLSASAAGRLPSARPHGQARDFPFADRLRQRFFVASYSRIAAGASGGAAELPDRDETVQAVPAPEQAQGTHAFPAGPASGTFLHAVIESLNFDADEKAISEAVRSQGAFHGIEPRWHDTLTGWISKVFATPLGAPGCALRDIRKERRVDELEFYFQLNTIRAPALDEALRQVAPQGPRPSLHFDDVQGLMKGYLDLVFEHGGRYWIADYKSNRLGSDLAAYTPEALDRAMVEHRYDLQYLLYTVALHRYLAFRIPGYDYELHFGGVLYLFLRGMAPEAAEPRGVWYTRPGKSDVERLDAYLAGTKS